MAEYYHQGLSPPTAAEAVAARYAAEISGLRLPNDALLDELVAREVDRLAEVSTNAAGGSPSRDDLSIRTLGAFMAAGMVDQDAAVASLRRAGQGQDGNTGGAMRERLDAAAAEARGGKDYSSATATPRRDMNSALAERLGINTAHALTAGEVANLLNGQRADGDDIKGKQKQAATEGIGTVFAMEESRIPTRAELANVLAGKKVDGTALPASSRSEGIAAFPGRSGRPAAGTDGGAA